MRVASGTPDYLARTARDDAIFAVFNVGEPQLVFLPDLPLDRTWMLHLDTARPGAKPARITRAVKVAANSVAALALEAVPLPPRS
jgi:hypothetical protein